MDQAQVSSRLAEIARLALEERADVLDRLIDDLEAALEETSTPDDSPST